MTHSVQSVLTKSRLHAATLAMVTIVCCVLPAMGQYSAGMGATAGFPATQSSSGVTGFNGSVPSGPATNEVLYLTLRDAITRALRYNLATIESGENARIARGQRLLALSKLLPVGFLFVPLTAVGYVGLPKEKSNAAAGLMNFMRNIGQSVGTSAVTTLIARRSQYHQSVLAEYTRSLRFDEAVAALANRLTHVGLSLHFARQQALARMYSMVIVQAQAISYVEVYWLLAVTSVLMFLLSFLLARNEPGATGDVPVH